MILCHANLQRSCKKWWKIRIFIIFPAFFLIFKEHFKERFKRGTQANNLIHCFILDIDLIPLRSFIIKNVFLRDLKNLSCVLLLYRRCNVSRMISPSSPLLPFMFYRTVLCLPSLYSSLILWCTLLTLWFSRHTNRLPQIFRLLQKRVWVRGQVCDLDSKDSGVGQRHPREHQEWEDWRRTSQLLLVSLCWNHCTTWFCFPAVLILFNFLTSWITFQWPLIFSTALSSKHTSVK